MPLTLLEHGFLRWPRHVTRLDSRRHQQVTRYVLKDGMDRAACHETICFRLLKCHGRFSIIALDGKIKGVFLSDYKVTHTHDTIMFCFRRNELFSEGTAKTLPLFLLDGEKQRASFDKNVHNDLFNEKRIYST
jgi:hypothetical protein